MPHVLRPSLLLIAAMLLSAGPAAAQGFSPWPAPGAQQPQRQEPPPCFKEFTALREESDKRGAAVQAAGKRKVAPAEGCRLLNALISSDAKFVKFADQNTASCGIPPQVASQLKERHGQILKVRDQVCQAAAAQAARPTGPSLSDALGTTRLPDSSNIKAGRGGGTFDTLTGTALGKQ